MSTTTTQDASGTVESRLAAAGHQLPGPPAPAGSYVPAVRVGDMVYLAGAICVRDGVLTHTGPVGGGQTVESAREGAAVCALNLLAMLRAEIGDLGRVRRVVSVTGFVQAGPGFADSPAVVNGASEVFGLAFGEAGRHARAAVAVTGLPRNSTVEVQALVQVA